ncbi:MAG: hypothetical protein ACPL7B_05315 [Candidatus Poribacteria bacterium]
MERSKDWIDEAEGDQNDDAYAIAKKLYQFRRLRFISTRKANTTN